MLVKLDYKCPACNQEINEHLKHGEIYVCKACQEEFSIYLNTETRKIILTPLDTELMEPLGLPKGSVRSLIMIILSITAWILIFLNKTIPTYLLNLLLLIIGYYFVIRSDIVIFKTQNVKIELKRKQPLYLPEGFIRGFIAIGFLLCAFYLVVQGDILKIEYAEFFFIMFGLMFGFVIGKATKDYR